MHHARRHERTRPLPPGRRGGRAARRRRPWPGFEGGGAVHPAVPPAGEHPAGVAEAEELPLCNSFLYGSGNFGSGVWYAFNNFILPGFLDPLHVPAPIIGLLASTRSFEGSVIQPVVGAWSDRTWSRRFDPAVHPFSDVPVRCRNVPA